MIELLLNSQYSDDFQLGKHFEEKIPTHLSNRIIRHAIDARKEEVGRIAEFLRNYDNQPVYLEQLKKIIEEYFLDGFVEKIRQMGFDSVDYYRLEEPRRIGGYFFKPFNKGKSARVERIQTTSAAEQEISMIRTIVVITKGEKKQAIICDPRVRYPKSENIEKKLEYTRLLLKKTCPILYMGVFTQDLAQKGLRKRHYSGSPMYSHYITEFLSEHENTLCLLYSVYMHEIVSVGKAVLQIMGAKLKAPSRFKLKPTHL